VLDVAQVGLVKVSLINVTAPLRARARPWTVTLLFTVIEVRARMFPTKTESPRNPRRRRELATVRWPCCRGSWRCTIVRDAARIPYRVSALLRTLVAHRLSRFEGRQVRAGRPRTVVACSGSTPP
jgi:hypothetical protein